MVVVVVVVIVVVVVFDMNVMINKNGLCMKRLSKVVTTFAHSDNEHNRYGVNKNKMCRDLTMSNEQ